MLPNIMHILMPGNFGVFSFLRSWKLTRFLSTCISETSFKIWTFSAFLYIAETTRTNFFKISSHNIHNVYSYFEKGCRKKCAPDNPERQYGIWSISCSWHCSYWIFYCCFLLAFANIILWPLVPFFQISLKNSELKITHNTFRDCRVHFFRQPFSKELYNKVWNFHRDWFTDIWYLRPAYCLAKF